MSDHVERVLQQWSDERPDLRASPMGVVGRIQRASRLIERELSENFARHGLEHWEFDVLATLRRSGPPYRLTAGALTASSMVTSGAITNRVDRLVTRGLVTRGTDPDNRRCVLITLTGDGWKLIEDVLSPHVEHEESLLARLSAKEQQQLATLLRTLLVGLGDKPPQARRSADSTSGQASPPQ